MTARLTVVVDPIVVVVQCCCWRGQTLQRRRGIRDNLRNFLLSPPAEMLSFLHSYKAEGNKRCADQIADPLRCVAHRAKRTKRLKTKRISARVEGRAIGASFPKAKINAHYRIPNVTSLTFLLCSLPNVNICIMLHEKTEKAAYYSQRLTSRLATASNALPQYASTPDAPRKLNPATHSFG
jgi:hypothetical protein